MKTKMNCFSSSKVRCVFALNKDELIMLPGEFTILPKGACHWPIAEEEVEVLLLEPASTNGTGGVPDPRSSEGVWL